MDGIEARLAIASAGGDARPGMIAPYLVVGVFVIAALLVNPIGEFPIADDWAYAQSVRNLLARGELKFSNWGAVNLISHVAWGSVAGLVFGPSYTVLRLSTLVFAAGRALAIYRLALLAGASVGAALLTTAVGALNPLYFFVSFSFMTDVPFAAMMLISFALLAESVHRQGRLPAVFGWAAGIAALLNRQTGLAIPIAWSLMRKRPWQWRSFAMAAAPIAAFILIQFGYQTWLRLSGREPRLYGYQMTHLMGDALSHPFNALTSAVKYSFEALFYFGLFLLPLTVPIGLSLAARLSRNSRAVAIGVFLIIGVVLGAIPLAAHHPFPMFDDTINTQWGIGVEADGVGLPAGVRTGLTFVSAYGVLLLLLGAACAIIALLKHGDRIEISAMALAAILAAPLPFVSYHFDRYLIPIIPCVALGLLAGPRLRGAGLYVGYGLALVMAAISVAATHDFMAWKRVQAAAYAEALSIAPVEQVDAGWVLDGAQFYPRFTTRADINDTWHLGDEIVVNSDLRPGYKLISRRAVHRWLTTGNEVFVQRRRGAN